VSNPDRHPGAACAAVNVATAIFTAGQIIVATLGSPREKFWGALLDLSALGLSMRGIELRSLDDFARQLKSGEAVAPAFVFFPMHRLERIELDAHNGDIPSVAEHFHSKTGRTAESIFFTHKGDGGGAA
jgi:hypothetical protein